MVRRRNKYKRDKFGRIEGKIEYQEKNAFEALREEKEEGEVDGDENQAIEESTKETVVVESDLSPAQVEMLREKISKKKKQVEKIMYQHSRTNLKRNNHEMVGYKWQSRYETLLQSSPSL
ncbi:hypothetical protein RDI58_001267 [Solanum bulbocastanum]|uniref:Uncharacterized protein n=1 Tax=Solanum bulbocastanum TaxID=147425 RepID=A0AAN8U7N9_SOLBU